MLLFITVANYEGLSSAYFNTSHVTVYLYSIKKNSITFCYFNTSHVTVYRTRQSSTQERL